MDPSLPSTLMPLVCPYLSYEDTVRCMQLNSSFNRYIDDNWKNMTKKDIYIDLSEWESDSKKDGPEFYFFTVTFGSCTKISDGVIVKNECNFVYIHETYIDMERQYLKPFLRSHFARVENYGNIKYDLISCCIAHEYIHISPRSTDGEPRVKFAFKSKQEGLKIMLDALLLRFSMGLFETAFRVRLSYVIKTERADLENGGKMVRWKDEDTPATILKWFKNFSYYRTASGYEGLTFIPGKEPNEFLNDIEKVLGARKYYIEGGYHDWNLLNIDTSLASVRILQYELTATVLLELLTEWMQCLRTIKDVQISNMYSTPENKRRLPMLFEDICLELNVKTTYEKNVKTTYENNANSTGDETIKTTNEDIEDESIIRWFEIRRKDGRTLKVLIYSPEDDFNGHFQMIEL